MKHLIQDNERHAISTTDQEVIRCSIETGLEVNRFKSREDTIQAILQESSELGGSRTHRNVGNALTRVLHGQRGSYLGFSYRYAEDDINSSEEENSATTIADDDSLECANEEARNPSILLQEGTPCFESSSEAAVSGHILATLVLDNEIKKHELHSTKREAVISLAEAFGLRCPMEKKLRSIEKEISAVLNGASTSFRCWDFRYISCNQFIKDEPSDSITGSSREQPRTKTEAANELRNKKTVNKNCVSKKRKLSPLQKRNCHSNRKLQVVQMDGKTKKEIARYNSRSEAARALIGDENIACHDSQFKSVYDCISGVINGKKKTCRGFIWKEVDFLDKRK